MKVASGYQIRQVIRNLSRPIRNALLLSVKEFSLLNQTDEGLNSSLPFHQQRESNGDDAQRCIVADTTIPSLVLLSGTSEST